MHNSAAMSQYKRVDIQASVDNADPYTLTLMLFNGAVERLNTAKMHIKHNNVGLKGESISKAISIIDGLRSSLDMKKGGEIAKNLESLYEYMQRQLLDVTVSNKPSNIDEVISLMNEIRSGWTAIPVEQRHPK
ncbi:Flagellar biosynthesis protein FliS [hydrothermal vent metagenome]|uniref:Flagellar biosynthesis protein FliS n=1 Tax=hydrothermal vent metagenome TaxID=652676 RepID=A0A3B0X874_9ZZZZ